MGSYRALRDEEIIEVTKGGPLPADVPLADFAFDALRMRRALRGDSRRAEQLRSVARALTVATDKAEEAIKGETAVQAAEAAVAERIAAWLESIGDDELSRMIREGRWR